MLIRPAEITDAGQAASVLRRSIHELCVPDHGGEEHTLRQWLSNKTPEIVSAWIADTDRCIIVAEQDGVFLGVGGASHAGEITLNYVARSPLQRCEQSDPRLTRRLSSRPRMGRKLVDQYSDRSFILCSGRI